MHHKCAQVRYRQRRIAEGLCGQCGQRPLATTVRCRECADAHNERNAQRKSRLKQNGMCKVCGRQSARRRKTLCSTCARKASGYKQKAKDRRVKEKEHLLDLLFEMFADVCSIKDGKYDHCCLSTNESVQDVLVEAGLIKRDQCVRP